MVPNGKAGVSMQAVRVSDDIGAHQARTRGDGGDVLTVVIVPIGRQGSAGSWVGGGKQAVRVK